MNGALDLRLLGVAPNIPPAAFTRFLPVMWFGLCLNVVTGLLLLIAYPTKALTNPVFYLKLALIGAGLLILREIIRRIRGDSVISRATKVMAVVSLVVWAATIATGRLLAYTCTRLTVDMSC